MPDDKKESTLTIELSTPEPPKKESTRDRKFRELRESIGPKFQDFKQGVKLGGAIGLAFGGIWGGFYAIRTKSFLVIPASMLSSGIFFASIVGIGSIMRTEELPSKELWKEIDDEYFLFKYDNSMQASINCANYIKEFDEMHKF